jgi:2-polyprenyl-6-methoxyphenol hydroxylase-like FAD-dependent oxidoreductase
MPRLRGRALLLGDAAHVMPPFTDKGANYAMLDALELADNLTPERFADTVAAIHAYDMVMLARTSDAIREPLASQDMVIAADAPSALVAHISGR